MEETGEEEKEKSAFVIVCYKISDELRQSGNICRTLSIVNTIKN